MKKSCFVIILLLIFVLNVNAQYLPFIESEKSWLELVENELGVWFLDDHQLTGDTTIGDYTYKKLELIKSSDPNAVLPYYFGAIRENIDERKVYIVFAGQTSELLLYDFTLEVGEEHTFHHCYYAAPTPSIPATFIVDSIGVYIDQNGLNRKVWYLNYSHNGVVGRIVEGVGSNTGIFSYSCHIQVWKDLVCVHKDSLSLFTNDFPFGIYCPSIISSNGKAVSQDLLDLKLYPNPSNQFFNIEFSNPTDFKDLHIFAIDQMGRFSHLNTTAQFGKVSCDITGLPNGLYHILIQIDKDATIVRKLYVER